MELVEAGDTVPSLRDVYLDLEAMLYRRVAKAFPDDWNEDFLSRSLCEILRDHSPYRFRTWDGNVVEVYSRFKKNSGKLETAKGDIGVLVRVETRAGVPITAWGYLEAKRRYASGLFDEVRPDQFERIARNAPQAMLLLYDFDDVTFNYDVSRDAEHGSGPRSRAVVVPMLYALALNDNSVDLYSSCVPLAHQVCFRYFQGLDLAVAEEFAEIEAFFRDHRLIPSFLLEVDARTIEQGEPEGQVSVTPSTGGGGGDARPEEEAFVVG